MPRDGSNIYTLPFPNVTTDTSIESPVYNGFTNDVANDLNAPRPIIAGGTGANNANDALIALSAEKSNQVVTNFDSHVWLAGSFSAATTATGEPVDGHAFSGIVYMADSNNIVVEARDSSDGKLYIRRKVASVWGAWVLDGDLSGVNAAIAALDSEKVDKVGDTMTGMLVLPITTPTLDTHATNKFYVDNADLLQNTAINNRVRYDAVQLLSAGQQVQARSNISAPLRGYLAGLTLSAAGASATFGIAAGEAANSTNTVLMTLASAYTKTTSAWAVGSGAGALDTGGISAAAFYHVFLIKRLDTGVVDILVSLSATAPTLPASYTVFRRIGSLFTAASLWGKFSQLGDEFLLDTALISVNAVTGSIAAQTATLPVPTGLKVLALINVAGVAGTGNDGRILVSSFDKSDEAPTIANYNAGVSGTSANTTQVWGAMQVRTNTSGQIRYRAVSTTGTVFIGTYGWIDRRGRDD